MEEMLLEVLFVFCFYLFCTAEWKHFSNSGRGSSKEHFCEIFLKKKSHLPRRCGLKVFLFLALVAILFSGAEPF